jgi:hypothetical protein
MLPCSHLFCTACIDPWVTEPSRSGRPTCPLCRKSFVSLRNCRTMRTGSPQEQAPSSSTYHGPAQRKRNLTRASTSMRASVSRQTQSKRLQNQPKRINTGGLLDQPVNSSDDAGEDIDKCTGEQHIAISSELSPLHRHKQLPRNMPASWRDQGTVSSCRYTDVEGRNQSNLPNWDEQLEPDPFLWNSDYEAAAPAWDKAAAAAAAAQGRMDLTFRRQMPVAIVATTVLDHTRSDNAYGYQQRQPEVKGAHPDWHLGQCSKSNGLELEQMYVYSTAPSIKQSCEGKVREYQLPVFTHTASPGKASAVSAPASVGSNFHAADASNVMDFDDVEEQDAQKEGGDHEERPYQRDGPYDFEIQTEVGPIRPKDCVFVRRDGAHGFFYAATVTKTVPQQGITVQYMAHDTASFNSFTETLLLAEITLNRVRFECNVADIGWTWDEGRKLLRLINTIGRGNWVDIAQQLGTFRTADACSSWYQKYQKKEQQLALAVADNTSLIDKAWEQKIGRTSHSAVKTQDHIKKRHVQQTKLLPQPGRPADNERLAWNGSADNPVPAASQRQHPKSTAEKCRRSGPAVSQQQHQKSSCDKRQLSTSAAGGTSGTKRSKPSPRPVRRARQNAPPRRNMRNQGCVQTCPGCAGKHKAHTCGKCRRHATVSVRSYDFPARCPGCDGKHKAHTCGRANNKTVAKISSAVKSRT